MGDCDLSCSNFAQCAVDECTGYDADSFEDLKNGCLESCTPVLATIFDSKVTCQEKFDFVATVEMDFPAYCASTTGGFCELYTSTCGDWMGDVSCADWFNSAEAGTPGDMSGATQACYGYHLLAAAEDADTHCPHARGEAVCVGDTPPPPAGACTNPEDTEILTSLGEEALSAQIEACVASCFGGPDACLMCLADATNLSTECSTCFSDVTLCTIENCIGDCAGGASPACDQCRADNCNEAFSSCAGIEP